MSLKIIGAGFGRTGTLSTKFALEELGYPCYHMTEVTTKSNKGHLDFWTKVSESAKGSQQDWNQVFSKYSAAVDFPASCVWKELMEAYPDAKVILTLHPKGPAGWYKSSYETIYAIQRMWESRMFAKVVPVVKKMRKMTSNLIWNGFLKGAMENKEAAIN